jgi:hypothetical protein
MQRTKGATYERELCAILSSTFGRPFGRKLGQARDSGNDIDCGPLVIEAKRRKTLGTVMGWLAQAIAATAPGRIPVVFGREDNGENIAILRLSDFLSLAGPAIRAGFPPHPEAV